MAHSGIEDLPKFLPLDEHFETKAIHTAYNPINNPTKAIIPPITLSSSFHQSDISKIPRYKYSRYGNPNREMLETTLAVLENGKFAHCFASGVAAIAMVTHFAKSGDHILCVDDVYIGTHIYLQEIAANHGLTTSYVDCTVVENIDKHIEHNTKIVWLESPTNPLMKIIDIKAITQRVKSLNRDLIVVADNSFLSSYFQRPLDLGVDVVLTSVTKYTNGHSDLTMGVVIVNDSQLHEKLARYQGVIGAVPSPFDCYLALRGLKTMSYRMKGHMCNAFKVAKYLEKHEMVEKVLYPGLPSHPGHNIALTQWHGVAGMISFYIKGGGADESALFLKSLKLFSTGLSYGGYESLAEIPALISHKDVSTAGKSISGITPNLIRISIGLESCQDIIADLESAFRAVAKK